MTQSYMAAGWAFGLLLLPMYSDHETSGPPQEWYHESTSDHHGISSQKAYELLTGRSSQGVIVAVVDTGVDPDHEDLDQIMWVNEDEIPGNGIDDDHNGYIDDIHGWNFLGNSSGANIHREPLEETRIFRAGPSFPGDFRTYTSAVRTFQSAREHALKQLLHYTYIKEDVEGFSAGNSKQLIRKLEIQQNNGLLLEKTQRYLAKWFQNGKDSIGLDVMLHDIDDAIAYYQKSLDHYYNPQHEAREKILNSEEVFSKGSYGNPDVRGPDASHGTHVAGIIAAVRDNGVGIQGIAEGVRIMSVRVVPDGDERDKDVAAAIRYAVDNGAKIINMSFGKAFSWDKKIVDKAVKYAKRKDVLLVHAAGNSATALDGTNNFPNPIFGGKTLFSAASATNWIEVGAITYYHDERLVASFSNYSEDQVDLFAPGYQINSTLPDNQYGKYNGTSMAAPMVTGVAAILRSYFPELSAPEVKEIIMQSATPILRKVKRPSDQALVEFATLSKTGAILNAADAVALALSKD